MKIFKAVIIIVTVSTSFSLFAQGGWTPTTNHTTTTLNVGIGTNSPAVPLHIEKSINGELNLLLHNTYNTGTRTYITSFPNKSSIQSDKDFTIATNGGGWSDKFIVTNSGNVGIGNNIYPESPLTIVGSVPELNLLIRNNGNNGARTFLTASQGKSSIQTDKDFTIVTSGGGWSDKFRITNAGFVGIGTNATPENPLEIVGSSSELNLLVRNNSTNGARTYLTAFPGKSSIQTDKDFTIRTNAGGWSDKFILTNTGNVGIGINDPGRYKLNVAGPVRANEIVVNTSGADFVFEDNYSLKPLTEVEAFIKANKHLPEIPAASEMQREGMSVGELQTKLLQKIEELTLYVIELKKENEEQNQREESILQENKNLNDRIQKLENE